MNTSALTCHPPPGSRRSGARRVKAPARSVRGLWSGDVVQDAAESLPAPSCRRDVRRLLAVHDRSVPAARGYVHRADCVFNRGRRPAERRPTAAVQVQGRPRGAGSGTAHRDAVRQAGCEQIDVAILCVAANEGTATLTTVDDCRSALEHAELVTSREHPCRWPVDSSSLTPYASGISRRQLRRRTWHGS